MNIPLRRYWKLLVQYLRAQRRKVVLLAVLLLGSIGLQLANPLILRAFIDSATAGGALEGLTLLAGAFFVLALVQQVVAVMATYVGEDVGWTATNSLRFDLAKHCLNLDMGFHTARTPGLLIERVDGDVTTLSNFFSQFVVQLLGNGLLLLGILGLMLVEDWRVSLALAAFVLLTLLALGRVRNVAVPHWKAARQARAELYGFIEERLGGTEEIRANGAQSYVMRRFFGLMRATGYKELKAGLMASTMVNTAWILFAIGNAVAFVVSALLFERNELTIGTAYLIFHYTNMLNRPIERIMEQMQDLQRAGASINRVEELLHTQGKTLDGPGAALPDGPLSVEFDGVSFAYNDETRTEEKGPGSELDSLSALSPQHLVLSDITLQLGPGRVLGVLGRTGSGKTTLTRLLLRLYDPTEGAIRLGGVDHRTPRLHDLRRRIGTVTQNVQLFHATVRDNLTFFDESITDERIVEVLRRLGLSAWYAALPAGLDSMLATGGGGLSAGEAQLLAFARVFLQNPGLVILDEASSRLDPATEHLIERAIDTLARDRTVIIIAHRLGTVQRADEILILEHGLIVEHGGRVRLALDPASRFSRLLQAGMEEVLA